jgi:hypothetical protein
MNAIDYRKKAAEVLREAGAIRDGTLKQALLDLSKCYVRLAELSEKHAPIAAE